MVLWLMAMLGYFGYLTIDAIIPFAQHFDYIKQMDTESVMLLLFPIFIPFEMFIGSVKLFCWRKSGMESIFFGTMLYIAYVIYIMVRLHISSIPPYFVRDIITAIACPIATYSVLQITTNGRSCWSQLE